MFNRVAPGWRRYRIAGASIVALCFLVIAFGYTNYLFLSTLIHKSRVTRSDLVQRDLRELVGRFDADERYVLNANVTAFIGPSRSLVPLLLPRQYYVALPAGNNSFVPRPPPRNCYIGLFKADVSYATADTQESFCAYFSESRTPGSYLFLSILLNDSDIVTLQPGDTSLSSDLIRLKVTSPYGPDSWIVALQTPRTATAKGRYELTAFHERAPDHLELDRRLEGWAFEKLQPDGSRLITMSMRVDVRAILGDIPVSAEDDPWPPVGWNLIKFQLERKDVMIAAKTGKWKSYAPEGPANLGLPSLAASILSSGANLTVIRDRGGKSEARHSVKPLAPISAESKEHGLFGKTFDNDLIFYESPLVRSQLLPDTTISFEVDHPGMFIEQGIWQGALALGLCSLAFFCLSVYLIWKLLIPILRLTSSVRALVASSTGDHPILPFTDRENEIGSLASAFTDLLNRLRAQQIQEIAARERRAEDVERQQREEAQQRASNSKIVGHEIRAPLQALMSLNPAGSPSRRYIDKMRSAVASLFGSAALDASFDARPLNLVRFDLAKFLREVANNSPIVDIPDVIYDGPPEGIIVMADPNALEDVLSNILGNAHRYRPKGTHILMKARQDENLARTEIFNFGYPIPAEIIGEIFDLHFSTKSEALGENGRIDHGIGLYVARSYLTKMAGEICAENRPGGVAFLVDLPIARHGARK